MYLFLIDMLLRIAFALGNVFVAFGIVFILFIFVGWEDDFKNWYRKNKL